LALKSTFKEDIKKEQQLAALLDAYYSEHLKQYNFDRKLDNNSQFAGIDLVLTHKETGQRYSVDEKAQLDYINEDLPTFAFEISYKKEGVLKKGWLFDADKKTEFYSLITAIYSDAPNIFTSCKITLVNRKKLIDVLSQKGINEALLTNYADTHDTAHGKLKLRELNHRTQGYLYISSKNKAETPVNLILRLDFLLKNGLAKHLI